MYLLLEQKIQIILFVTFISIKVTNRGLLMRVFLLVITQTMAKQDDNSFEAANRTIILRHGFS